MHPRLPKAQRLGPAGVGGKRPTLVGGSWVPLNWMAERKTIRMYTARLSAILDELDDYYHYGQYKKRFKLLFEFYQLEELLK